MRARELRDLSDPALLDQIATTRRDLFGLRIEPALLTLADLNSLGR